MGATLWPVIARVTGACEAYGAERYEEARQAV
jgi:hypothetical protein